MNAEDDAPVSPGRRRVLGKSLLGLAGSVLAPVARAAGVPSSATIALAGIAPGQHVTRRVGGYPVIVLNRSQELLSTLKKDTGKLADPDSRHSQQPVYARNPWRSRLPQWLVLVNHCTFDGCRTGAATAAPAIFAGFGCPCCGSRYDIAGRVLKSQPAPRNMAVPSYDISTARGEVRVTHVPKVKTQEPDHGISDS